MNSFRPLIWDYLWNWKRRRTLLQNVKSFRPLSWGYLWNHKTRGRHSRHLSFRPLSWGYLWNEAYWEIMDEAQQISVPLFGVISEIYSRTTSRLQNKIFPSPKLGLSLKYAGHGVILYLSGEFPSPKLGLSLKLRFRPYQRSILCKFPSPYLGLSLKSAI